MPAVAPRYHRRDSRVTGADGAGGISQSAEMHKFARIAWDGDVVGLRAPPLQKFGPAEVTPPPGAFLQATAHGQTALTACVQEALGDASNVADLFDEGWRQSQGLKRVKAETRDLFRRPVLADELRKTDAVIIDPPRAGAEAQTAELARSAVPRIAAVSCNPVTFARDPVQRHPVGP